MLSTYNILKYFSYFFHFPRETGFLHEMSNSVFWGKKKSGKYNVSSLCCLLKLPRECCASIFSRRHFEIFFLIFPSLETGFDISCKLSPTEAVRMTYQLIVGCKRISKVSSNILSAEIAQRMVEIKGTSQLFLH